MTKQCSLKESFIEKQLDKYQPNWREGEDITAETKQKIRDYVVEKLPEDLKEDVTCITDYSIWNMAQKIREREGLPLPKKTNKGKVSECKPSEKTCASMVSECKPSRKVKFPKKEALSCSSPDPEALEIVVRKLVDEYGYDQVMSTLDGLGCEEI